MTAPVAHESKALVPIRSCRRWRTRPPNDVLRGALAEYGTTPDRLQPRVEDMVVLHEAARAAKDLGVTPRVFLLDTGRLHQETYDLVDRARDKYGFLSRSMPPTRSWSRISCAPRGRTASIGRSTIGASAAAFASSGRWLERSQGARLGHGAASDQGPTRADVRVVEQDLPTAA